MNRVPIETLSKGFDLVIKAGNAMNDALDAEETARINLANAESSAADTVNKARAALEGALSSRTAASDTWKGALLELSQNLAALAADAS